MILLFDIEEYFVYFFIFSHDSICMQYMKSMKAAHISFNNPEDVMTEAAYARQIM